MDNLPYSLEVILLILSLCVLRRHAQDRICCSSGRRRLWTRQWLQRRQSRRAYPNLCHELGVGDQQRFQNFSRFAPEQVQKLLEMVTPHIQCQNTNFHDCISPESLMVTLRFLATENLCHNHLVKRNAVLVNGMYLNDPTLDIKETYRFLEDAISLILNEAVKKGTDVLEKVCEWQPPEKLREILDLELREVGEPQATILKRCQDVIQYSVKTGHPHFFNQLYAGMDPYTLVGRLITETTNASLYTYEVAPVFVLTEDAVLRKMMEFLGWEEGGDGIFSPGGSISNMYAVNVARYLCCPDVKEHGLSAMPRLVLFTSQECHYSVTKAAAFLGIGTKNVYVVSSDERGKMIPAELEKEVLRAKAEGACPFMVNATSGTTVLGAFDPLEEIADICQMHKLWLHVDACWGGAAVLSRRHRHLLKGIQRANSVAWNPHKMLMAGLQCCAFMVRDKTGLLQRCHSARAPYLFQQDKFYDISYDTGDKSIQCSRKPDAFKFWLLWKAIGTHGLEERVNKAIALAKYLAMEIQKREGFRLLMEPEYANVCFWYIPPSLWKIPESKDFWEKIHKVAPLIKERMMKKGSMMIGYQSHGSRVNFFRHIVINPQLGCADMDFVLDEIEKLGKDL